MPEKIPALSSLLVIVFVSLLSFISPISPKSYTADLTLNDAPAQVYFNPMSGCTEAIINQNTNRTPSLH
jgi:hypothetical protein